MRNGGLSGGFCGDVVVKVWLREEVLVSIIFLGKREKKKKLAWFLHAERTLINKSFRVYRCTLKFSLVSLLDALPSFDFALDLVVTLFWHNIMQYLLTFPLCWCSGVARRRLSTLCKWAWLHFVIRHCTIYRVRV